MRKTTSAMLSLISFTILILFANGYSVRPSAQANADSYLYEQQKTNGYYDVDKLANLPESAVDFQNIPNSVLLPGDNITTNFLPILPSQQQLPIAEPTTAATAGDIVTQYQIPSPPILPSQQQLPIAEPTTAATAGDIVTQYQIPSPPILPSQQQLSIAEPTTAATAGDIVTQYQIPSPPILPSQQQLSIAEPTTAATAGDIVTQYQIPSPPILPSQQQLSIAEPTTAATAGDIVTQYQIPSPPILPSQQQLPIAEPTTAATAGDIVTQYQIPSPPILPLPNNFGQYSTGPSYETLIPEPFTSQFPYSYQIQQQEEQRPFNVSTAQSPTLRPSSSIASPSASDTSINIPFMLQNPSTLGDEIFEDGSIGTESSRYTGLQGGENILDADSTPYLTNGNYTSAPVQSTASQPTERHNGFQPFIYSSTPEEDDNPSLTLVPLNTTQNPFPNLSQSSQYSQDTTNFDNTRNNTITDSPLSNIANTNSQAPSSPDVNFNLTSHGGLGSTLLDTNVSNKPSSVVVENDTISSSTSLATKTTPISKLQNITLSNVTTPHLGGSNINATDPFSNLTNSTILQLRGTSLPSDAAMVNSTRDTLLPTNNTAVASSSSSDSSALDPLNEISASCDMQLALNETTTIGTGPDRTSGATIEQEALDPSSSTSSCDPELAVSGNTTYVTWTEGDEEDRQIFFAKSTDGGNSFAETVPLSNYAPSGSFNPQLAVSGNNVYVVWQEDDAITGNQDIFFKKSTDGGNSFTDKINLSKDSGGSGDPQIHVSGRNLYIVWDGTTPGANGIFLSKSTDGGNTFSSAAKLSNGKGFSFLPKIGKVSGNNVEIMWRNSENAIDQVFSRKSTDGGGSFTNIQKLSDEIKNSIWEEFSSQIPFNNVVPR